MAPQTSLLVPGFGSPMGLESSHAERSAGGGVARGAAV